MYYTNDGLFGSFTCKVFDNYFPIGEPLFVKNIFFKIYLKNLKEPFDGEPQQEYPCIIYGPTCDGADKIEA